MASEQNDLDRDVEASMRIFKKAQVGPITSLPPVIPSRVLLVLDGSAQDASSVAAATYLQHRFGTETVLLDARESEPEEVLSDLQSPSIPKLQVLPREGGPSYDAIINAVTSVEPNLVILPCPFGRDFQSVGSDSAGTVIDVLLSRCAVAMLIIRRADQALEQATGEIALVTGSECDSERRAAGWVYGLAKENAQVSLDLVVDKEYYENIRQILSQLAPDQPLQMDQVQNAMADAHAKLHAAMANAAQDAKVQYALRPLAPQAAPPSLEGSVRSMLIVLPLEVDDRFGHGFVQDRIRRSPHPVLVVPSHAGHGTQGDVQP